MSKDAILTFDESSRQWVQSLPVMPKELTLPAVVGTLPVTNGLQPNHFPTLMSTELAYNWRHNVYSRSKN